MDENLKKCKTFKDLSFAIFGVEYYNGAIKKKINDFCLENFQITAKQLLENNKKNYCLFCGKEINIGKKFCNNSCSASFNNKRRIVSAEQKNKTKERLEKYNEEKRNLDGINVVKKIKSNNKFYKIRTYENTCECCGSKFYGKKSQKFCSIKCSNNSESKKENNKKLIKRNIENGTFVGWKVRGKNMQSFPEKYWENVLIKHNIEFKNEVKVGRYFLDFLIEKNGVKIDLEIDGKQHKQLEIIEKDTKRDSFLKENGYVIYRIDWNEVCSDGGKEKMNEKINEFLKYVKNI